LPILAAVLAGTTAGAFIGEHWGVAALALTGLLSCLWHGLRAFGGDHERYPTVEWTVAQRRRRLRGQLELHYQPIVDCAVTRLSVRKPCCWRHPTLGLLPPGQFLPVAESSGLMPEIGAWVLGAACRQMREWLPLQWRPFRLAVNVSASQWDRLRRMGKGVLADAELPPSIWRSS
jgi:predicted signal transduction protein with EAL and GGDEF domain